MAVLVEDGRISAVASRTDNDFPNDVERIIAAPGAVLLPGLINTHTHLELTGLRGRIEHSDFADWIRTVRTTKERLSPEQFDLAAREGIADFRSIGVTAVADTGDSGSPLRAMAESSYRGIYFQEVFGPHPNQLDDSISELDRRVTELASHDSDTCRLGVSPHAPYTVSGPLYQEVARYARAGGLRMAGHLAESMHETQLFGGVGDFAAAWKRREIPLPEPSRSPVAYLNELGVLGADFLAIHCVQVDDRDRTLLEDSETTVVMCPRSNDRHGHGLPDPAAILGVGIPLALGTDSVASVTPADVLLEARVCVETLGIDSDQALDLVTGAAARVLGWEGRTGRIAVGHDADFCVRVCDSREGSAAHRVVSGSRNLMTVERGRVTWTSG